MKGSRTLRSIPERYTGPRNEYLKELHEMQRGSGPVEGYKCHGCGRPMAGVIICKPYAAVFACFRGKNKGIDILRPLCRRCAYKYGVGVVEADGHIYHEPLEFSETVWLRAKGYFNNEREL